MLIIKAMIKRLFLAFAMFAASVSAFAELPSASIKTLDGKTVDASKISNDGKPFVVTFFATWCKPCIRELKAINEYYADWQEETGMKVVAISIDQAQNVSKVKPLVKHQGWEYEVYVDPNSDLKRALGIENVPHLLIVDGKGNIVENHAGYTDGSERQIIKKIRELLKNENK